MARKVDVLWKGSRLYVNRQKISKLFRQISQELARPFDRQEIADAIKACIERGAEFVTEYLEQNFKLQIPEEAIYIGYGSTAETQETTGSGPVRGEDILSSNQALEAEKFVTVDEVPEKDIDESIASLENSGDIPEPPGATRQSSQFRVTKFRFIDVYAKSTGYEKLGESDRFSHPDGTWLQKSDGGPFHFEKYDSNGTLLQSYWLRDHCLLKTPLNLDAAVWSLCQNNPEKYTLVLADRDGRPTELRGKELMELVKSGRIKLYPAEYRLSYEEDNG
jgi:hypothetical protein